MHHLINSLIIAGICLFGGSAFSTELGLNKKEKAWLNSHSEIRLGAITGWPPYNFYDSNGAFAGISSEIIKRIETNTGLKFKYIKGDWDDLRLQIKEHKVDILSAVYYTPERAGYMLFTRPYSELRDYIFTRKDRNDIKDIKSIRRIAIVKGFSQGEIIRDKHPDIEIVWYNSMLLALEAVIAGHADAYIGSIASVSYLISSKQLIELKVAAPTGWLPVDVSMAVNTEHPELIGILNKAINTIDAKEINKINRQWFALEHEGFISHKQLEISLVIGFMLLAIASIWLLASRREVRARKKIEHKLYASTQHLKLYRDQAPMATIEWNPDFQVVDWNKAAEKMFGYPLDEVKGRNFVDIMLPESAVVDVEQIWKDLMAQTGGTISINENITKDGRVILCEWHNTSLIDESGNVIGAASIIQDITERKKAEEQMNHLAYYDYLTELPNRRLFIDRLQQAMKEAHRSEKLVALLFLDLDHFKKVNDSMGHEAGDLLLKKAAQRLTNCLRESDTVARLGGDEFAFVMPSVNHLDDVIIVAKQIIKTISKPFLIQDTELFITASIGITLYPLDDDNADDLIRNSDTAMYHAKDKGRNNFQFYNHEMRIQVEEQLKLEEELRQALLHNEFVLFYQPKIDTENNSVVGMEALIRWQHPQRGLVAPDNFIGAAEETGLIIPIGKWVLQEACKQTQLLNSFGIVPIHVSVNLSVRQLEDPELVRLVEQTLKDTELSPALLDLEITESMLMSDMDKVIQTLKDLSSLGVTISVDDFGTGHSSLTYLKQFPISTLKIDRSFISDIPEDKDDMSITIAIIQMANALGLKTVAEGVETKEQLAFLKQHECNLIQGYYFSKPIAFKEIEKLFQVDLGKENIVKINPAD